MPTHKRHFVPGDLQFLTSSTYHRAKLFESDRSGRRAALCASRPDGRPTYGVQTLSCHFNI